jgi:hypothetical protein
MATPCHIEYSDAVRPLAVQGSRDRKGEDLAAIPKCLAASGKGLVDETD